MFTLYATALCPALHCELLFHCELLCLLCFISDHFYFSGLIDTHFPRRLQDYNSCLLAQKQSEQMNPPDTCASKCYSVSSKQFFFLARHANHSYLYVTSYVTLQRDYCKRLINYRLYNIFKKIAALKLFSVYKSAKEYHS